VGVFLGETSLVGGKGGSVPSVFPQERGGRCRDLGVSSFSKEGGEGGEGGDKKCTPLYSKLVFPGKKRGRSHSAGKKRKTCVPPRWRKKKAGTSGLPLPRREGGGKRGGKKENGKDFSFLQGNEPAYPSITREGRKKRKKGKEKIG